MITKVVDYEESCEEEPTLSGFLEEVALVADLDSLDENADYVVLMTLHSAKGLEFPYVYLAGMEDGLFPSYMTITADSPEELEEERRLCYVGITRAMKDLTMTCAQRRMVRGETQYNKTSRFLKEIPWELLSSGQKVGLFEKKQEEKKENPYFQAKKAFQAKPFSGASSYKSPYNSYGAGGVGFQKGKAFGTPKSGGLDYKEGDRVRHIKFGEGTVQSIVEGGRDYEVTVEFDQVGRKKMFAAFAKLKKVQ